MIGVQASGIRAKKEEIVTALTNVSEPTRQRILQVCVRLFLEKKISGFLNLTLRAYNVPREEAEKAIAFVASLDIRKIAEGVMHQLLQALMMKYQFTLGGSAAGQ